MIRRGFSSSLFIVRPSATVNRKFSPSTSASLLFASSCPSSSSSTGSTKNSTSSSSSSTTTSASTTSPSSSTTTSGIPRKFSDEEIKQVVKALEADPELAVRVVSNLSPAARRQLVVAGSAFEWFGGHGAAKSEVSAADLDQDQVISTKDFDTWFEKALERRCSMKEGTTTGTSGNSNSDDNNLGSSDSASSSTSQSSKDKTGMSTANKLSFTALALLGLEAGLPFVGFGFLDNAAMILAGDVIDRSVGFYLGCSVLASAAMGNVVSGMMGMQLHGSIERLVHFLKLPVPKLSEEQRKSRSVFFAGHIGGTVGIATGLTLGMMPLFFLSDKEQANEHRAFQEIDLNKDGKLVLAELRKALKEAGYEVEISDEIALKLVEKYGDEKDKSLNAEQFHRLCVDLKAKGPLGMNVSKLAE